MDDECRPQSRLPGPRDALSRVADGAPRRRTMLALFGAAVTGGVVSNPGVATDVLQFAKSVHGGDPTPLDLVPADDATHTAVEDGRFTEGSTWEGGDPPGDGARILIPDDRTVTVAGDVGARIQWVGSGGR